MDIQIALNWAIQILVIGFVCVMVMDFVNGLFSLPDYAMPLATSKMNAPVATNSQALTLQQEPVAIPIPEPPITPDPKEQPQLAQLPDPWELNTEILPTAIQQEPVVLEFPTLKLLPPAASQAQPKARATKKSTQSATAKRTTKPTNKTATQTGSQSRKKSAA
ncbi:MAG: hypothetical protein RMY28_036270 [Nostoc sp. ChiSLP01]|nr:hypothetical protein [Nostoc sp. CmiSLP01]MDZ8286336.1 hypothetical protein [Nostoc sp. ChiSLP01]